MNAPDDWLPLFPLDLVLLPGAHLPLHIFEPRYRSLTQRCQEADQPFGIVRLHAGELAQAGCTARIERVLMAYPDGRSDILIRGESRFRLVELREHSDGYLEGRWEPLEDVPDAPADEADRILLERLCREYAKLAEDEVVPGIDAGAGELAEAVQTPEAGLVDAEEPATQSGSVAGDPQPFSFTVAAQIPLGHDERQGLLELRSEGERTEALLGHLARLLPRLRTFDQDRRKIRGNGKPVPAE